MFRLFFRQNNYDENMDPGDKVFAVMMGETCRKLRLLAGQSLWSAIMVKIPELNGKRFKIRYWDSELSEYLDVENTEDIPSGVKLLITPASDHSALTEITSPHQRPASQASTSFDDVLSDLLEDSPAASRPPSASASLIRQPVPPKTQPASSQSQAEAASVMPQSVPPQTQPAGSWEAPVDLTVRSGAAACQPSTSYASISGDTAPPGVQPGPATDLAAPASEKKDIEAFDVQALPLPLRHNIELPGYELTDQDRRAIVDAAHGLYSAKSPYPEEEGYRLINEAVFARLPKLLEGTESPKDIMRCKQNMRKQLRNKFKNTRSRCKTGDVAQQREETERHRVGSRMEGFRNFLPKLNNTKLERNVMAAQLSSELQKLDSLEAAEPVLRRSFPLRRNLLFGKGRRSIGALRQMYPLWFSEQAVWLDLGIILEREPAELLDLVSLNVGKVLTKVAAKTKCTKDQEVKNLMTICGEESLSIEHKESGVHFRESDDKGLYVGGEKLFDMGEHSDLELLLVAAAVHAVYGLKFGPPCPVTMRYVYKYVLGFSITEGAYCRSVHDMLG